VIGVDLAEAMLAEAKRKTPTELVERVRFEAGDASDLSFPADTFDLVTHANMIPFFNELARLVKPGGQVLFAFSGGAQTPIYVSSERLRSELGRRGFTDFAEFAAGNGSVLLARKADRS
jgi:SAM-dependent methyltransferase